MAYLLVIPFGLYLVLATFLLSRQPRGPASLVFALYALAAAAGTAVFMILGTTPHHHTAETAVYLSAIILSWAYLLFLPYTVIGLCFESWLRRNWRWLVVASLFTIIFSDILLLAFIHQSDGPLVYPVGKGFVSQRTFNGLHPDWLWGSLLILAAQAPLTITTAAGVYYRRLDLWRGAVPYTLVALLNVMLPLLSPLGGQRWIAVIAGLGYVPAILLIATRVFQSTRTMSLERLVLGRSLNDYAEGAMILDSQQRVVWHNAAITHWLAAPPLSAIAAPPHLDTFLGTSPLREAARDLLDNDSISTEVEVMRHQEEFVLRMGRLELNTLRDLPGAQLFTVRDITTSRVRRDLDERRQVLLALSAISEEISTSLEPDQVITRALEQVASLTPLDGVAVYLHDDDDHTNLTLARYLQTAPDSVHPPEHFSLSESVFGQIAAHEQHAIFVPDTEQDAIYGPSIAAHKGRAGAIVPLIVHHNVIGLLCLNYRSPHVFSPVEQAMLESIGQQLAVAIENARLLEQERQQRHLAETLRSVANVLSHQPLADALRTLLGHLQQIVPYARASILLKERPGWLKVAAQVGFENVSEEGLETIHIEIARMPYLPRLFQKNEPLLVADTTADDEWVPGEYPYGSWLGIPLQVRGEVLGCFSLSHQTANHFTPQHLELAAHFADQASIAVQNTQLFASEQHRRMQAELLQQASYTLVSSGTLRDALLNTLRVLRQLLDFDRAHIALRDREDGSWLCPAILPDTEILLEDECKHMASYLTIQRIIETRQPLLISDTAGHPDWEYEEAGPRTVRSWIGAPLVVREKIVGVLNVDSFQTGVFTSDHRETVQLFANQVGAAVENFYLLEQTSRQNTALRTMNAVIAASNEALTSDDLLTTSLKRLLERLSLGAGTIHRRDVPSEELHLCAVAGLPESYAAHYQRVPITDTLPPLTLPGGDLCRFYSVPLTSHGHQNGLLSVCTSSGAALSEYTKTLLTNLGPQLGVVLDNALLLEDTTRRAILSTDLSRLSLALSAQLEHNNVLDLVCQESIGILDVQGAYIWLLEDEQLVGAIAYGPGSNNFAGQVINRADNHLLPVRVLDEWRPHYVNHVQDNTALPPEFQAMTQAQAALAIPLIRADVALGTLLLVDTTDPDAFAPWQANQIGLLGVQTALALQNAQLFEEVRRRLDHLRLVNEVSRHSTAILTVRSLVENVAQHLFAMLDFDTIGLLQVHGEQLVVNSIFVREGHLPPDERSDWYTTPDSVAAQAVRQAEPVIANQLCNCMLPSDETFDCCVLAVPLLMADEVVGALVVERRNHDTISKEDLDVLEPLAAQLAISVSNARLFETIRQQAVDLEARVEARTDEIRREKERTELILRSVADAVIVFDVSDRVIMTNPAAHRLFEQYDLEHDLRQRILTLLADLLAPTPQPADETEMIELGSVTLQASAARMREGSTLLGTVVVLRDVTRQRELDRLKDQFVDTVSHELRTPLANIKLYLSLLKQGRPERRAGYMDVMERQIERLARLINELLQLSRLQKQRADTQLPLRQPLDLEALIDTVIADNNARAENEQKTLQHDCLSSPLPMCEGNPDQIVRALTNLVSNALNYSPTGGRVVVRSYVELKEHAQPESVIIEVKDDGIGIPANEISMIFERFYRGANVDPNIPGTGLGLAIVKDIVDLHGGSIEVESQQNQGSTFRLTLPTQNTQARRSEEES